MNGGPVYTYDSGGNRLYTTYQRIAESGGSLMYDEAGDVIGFAVDRRRDRWLAKIVFKDFRKQELYEKKGVLGVVQLKHPETVPCRYKGASAEEGILARWYEYYVAKKDVRDPQNRSWVDGEVSAAVERRLGLAALAEGL